MSLLNRQSQVRLIEEMAQNTVMPMMHVPDMEPDIQEVESLVDLTIDQLAQVITSDIRNDPFVTYLRDYSDSLEMLLNCIAIIKEHEKRLKKRKREASKLLESLLNSTKSEADAEPQGSTPETCIDLEKVGSFLDFSK